MKNFEPSSKLSARDVILRINNHSDYVLVEKQVSDALKAQFERARAYQEKKGVRFDLTFEEFGSKITPSRFRRMMTEMERGTFKKFMSGAVGYVITWKDREALRARPRIGVE